MEPVTPIGARTHLDPYQPHAVADGVNDRAALKRAEHYALLAEERLGEDCHAEAAAAAEVAQAWAAITTAARTGLGS